MSLARVADTAGQERYASLAPLYYRGAGAAVVVYDITSPASFEKARFWVKELQKHASPNINIVLVGNKKDLGESRRAVSREDARAFANENGMAMECEASALSGEGVVGRGFGVRERYHHVATEGLRLVEEQGGRRVQVVRMNTADE